VAVLAWLMLTSMSQLTLYEQPDFAEMRSVPRLAYWIAQVRHADAWGHRRVAKDGWHSGEMIKESDSGAKKNRRDVDLEFVEKAGIKALLDGVSAVDPDVLPGGGRFGLVHSAFDAVGHEMNSRVGSRPAGGDVMSKDECWSPGVISAPAVGDVESASTGEHGTKSGREAAEVLGARLGHLERHRVRPAGADFDVSRVEVPVEYFGHAIVEVGDVAVERHGHDGDKVRHCNVPFEGEPAFRRRQSQSVPMTTFYLHHERRQTETTTFRRKERPIRVEAAAAVRTVLGHVALSRVVEPPGTSLGAPSPGGRSLDQTEPVASARETRASSARG
jgi:hypothetical protein